MSTPPDNEFDLEKLFLPAWAQQEPSSAKYAKYEVPPERPERRGERRGAGGFGGRPAQPGARRDDNRNRSGDRRGPRPEGARGPRPEGGRERAGGGERPGQGGGQRFERRELAAPLPEISLSLVPDEKGVESLARQIKMTGRAYPLFDIAQMVLQKPERHSVVFSVKKNAEGQPIQPLFICALDDTLWLSEDEAVSHVLKKHFGTFYQIERTPTEPPKGKYTFVAQCGMSGAILGPPNYHDYQNQLRKLHSERYSRMPFEVYKSRVKIVRDEEVVKKWVDEQSWKTEFTCLNLPEPLRLENMEAVEKHFRETHKENIIKPVESHRLAGTAARNLRSAELVRLVRSVAEDQRRFPLQIATVLSQQFASHGLQFFKVNRTVTHVCVARPHHLDVAAHPISDGVRRIVDYVNAHPRSNRRQLVESLAPSPAAPTPPVAPTPVAEAGAPGVAAPVADASQPTPEQTAVISDLHWLIHQGHVIEFANGILETAKKPIVKPPKPAAPKAETAGAQPAPATVPAGEAQAPALESSVEALETSVSEPVSGDEASQAAEPIEGTPEPAAPAPTELAKVEQAEPKPESSEESNPTAPAAVQSPSS